MNIKDIGINKNSKILVIVESPKKCEKVKHYINELGYDNVKVLASKGHTTKIEDTADSYWNTGVYPNNQFNVKLKISDDHKDIVDNLKLQAKWADIVFIASDPDREGEILGYNIKNILKLKDKDYYRLTYHSITKQAISDGLSNLSKFNMDLIDSALSRSIIDKIIGYRLSPIARKNVQCKSVGRCQSSALLLLTDRENEINSFIPEKYFDLYLKFSKNNVNFKAKYQGTDNNPIKRIATKEECDVIIGECINDFIVKDIEYKDRNENPKPPFCTSTFNQECASKLGLTVKQATDCAQELYTSGFCSYLRTDDETMDSGFAKELLLFVKKTYGVNYVAEKISEGKKDENAQEGHECFRILDLGLTPEKFAKDHNELLSKVYRLIYNRTIASAMKPSIISVTTYNIYNGAHKFSMNSNELKFDGYKIVYNYKDESTEDKEEIVRETFNEGEKLLNCLLDTVFKTTTPPSRYKEATFQKELKDRGIGRPSTYASIIETIKSPDRGYVIEENKCLKPTDKGMKLSEYLSNNLSDIINIDYTREMEKELDSIANGKLDYLEFLKTFFDKLEDSASKVSSSEVVTKTCPECGKPLVKRKGKYGFFLGCSGYPTCKHMEKLKG